VVFIILQEKSLYTAISITENWFPDSLPRDEKVANIGYLREMLNAVTR
jgi:hypothetical protein